MSERGGKSTRSEGVTHDRDRDGKGNSEGQKQEEETEGRDQDVTQINSFASYVSLAPLLQEERCSQTCQVACYDFWHVL